MSSSGDDAAASTLPDSAAESDFTETATEVTDPAPTGGYVAPPVATRPPILSCPPCRGNMRFVILALTTLCITQILANQNSYNFTKIAVNNETDPSANYTTHQKTVLQAGTAIGSFAAVGPMIYALDRVPKKWILITCGALSTIATAMVPLMEPLGYYYFLGCRIMQGVAFCVTFPIAGTVTSEWASLKEHGIFLAFLTGFSQLSNIYLFASAGPICSTFGWKVQYYVMAVLGTFFFVLFGFFFTDKPTDNFRVTPSELAWIQKDKPEKSAVRDKIPYIAMLKSRVIWAVWTSAFADILAIQFINMFNAQYLKDYLNMSVLKTGINGALPQLVQWACKIGAGISSDKIRCCSEGLKLKVYNFIALGASGVVFCILAFIPQHAGTACFVVLIIGEGLIGFNTAGFNKCGTLHARQHSHFVMLGKVIIQSICIAIEPFITNGIITSNTPLQWGIAFWFHALLLIAAAVLFCFWAKAEAAPWTEPPETSEVVSEEDNKGADAEIPDSTAPSEHTMGSP